MKAILLIIIFSFLTPTLCLAHFPVFLKKDPELDTPKLLKRPYEKSIAIYTYFAKQNDLDVYQFEVKEKDLKKGPVEILVGTLVPACKPLKNLLTTWVITGPAQASLYQTPDEEIAKRIRFNPADGALIVENKTQGEVWYERYTRHYYFYQKRETLSLREVGTYRIHIWANDGSIGDYIFEFGDTEMWGMRDILYTLWVYPKLLLEKEIMTKNCKTSSMNGKI